MSEPIAVAIIGVIGSGLGSLIGVIASSKLTNYRLEQLEKKVEAHNNLIDRTYKLERDRAVFQEDLEHIKHDIETLEKFHHE